MFIARPASRCVLQVLPPSKNSERSFLLQPLLTFFELHKGHLQVITWEKGTLALVDDTTLNFPELFELKSARTKLSVYDNKCTQLKYLLSRKSCAMDLKLKT